MGIAALIAGSVLLGLQMWEYGGFIFAVGLVSLIPGGMLMHVMVTTYIWSDCLLRRHLHVFFVQRRRKKEVNTNN